MISTESEFIMLVLQIHNTKYNIQGGREGGNSKEVGGSCLMMVDKKKLYKYLPCIVLYAVCNMSCYNNIVVVHALGIIIACSR